MAKLRRFTVKKRPPNASIQHRVIRTAVLKEMLKIGRRHVRLRQKLTQNWSQKSRPLFSIEHASSPTKIMVRVRLRAHNAPSSTDNKSVYQLLDEGTSVRYATMTPDFQAKTKPGVIVSGPGRGGLAYVDTRKPRPGIEARNFDETINDKLHQPMKNAIRDGYRKGFKKANS